MSPMQLVTETPTSTSPASPDASAKLLVGQKALVTGANSGIGRGIALALGRAGADVVVNYIEDEAAANAVVNDLRHYGANSYPHHADVSSEQDVAGMFKRMVAEF